jgi:hypothetical protein
MERNWGLYRNSKLQIADALLSLGKTDASLRAYLEACYLDMNGPENLSGLGDVTGMPETPPFNLDGDTILAPGVLAAVNEVKYDLQVDLDQLRVVFLPVAVEMQRDLNLPLSPESAWSRLAEELPTAFDPADESTGE